MPNNNGNAEYDLFVSYARADEARVRVLVEALRDRGLRVWWDPHITVGGGFRSEIEAAIAASTLVLVCWTPTSVASEFVREEASAARAGGKYFPILLKQAELPIGFREANALKLASWDPFGADQSALDRLCQHISERISRNLEITHRIQRSSIARRWSELALAIILAAGIAAAILLMINRLEPGSDPVITTALRAGLAIAVALFAIFAFGAITGHGFRGAGWLPRAGLGLTALLATGAFAPLMQPALSPGALELSPPYSIDLRHTDRDGIYAETAAFMRTDVALIVPVVLTRDGAPAAVHVDSMTFELTLGSRVLGFRGLHFTNLAPGEVAGWIPGLGALNLPARFPADRPAQVRMVPLAPLSWSEFLEALTTDGRKRLVGVLAVKLASGETLSQNCTVSTAQDIIRQVEETPSIRGRPAMSIPLLCDQRL